MREDGNGVYSMAYLVLLKLALVLAAVDQRQCSESVLLVVLPCPNVPVGGADHGYEGLVQLADSTIDTQCILGSWDKQIHVYE